VAAALRKMEEAEGGEAQAHAEAFKARITQADEDAAVAAAAVHSTRTAVLSLQQEVSGMDQLDAAQLRAKMAAMAEQVEAPSPTYRHPQPNPGQLSYGSYGFFSSMGHA